MKKLIGLVVLLGTVFIAPAAPAHHRSSPGAEVYVQGFCYEPTPDRVRLAAVAIVRRYTMWTKEEANYSHVGFSLMFLGDKAGGIERFNYLGGFYRAWQRDAYVGQKPQWVGYTGSYESENRPKRNWDSLTISMPVGFGDHQHVTHQFHTYRGVARWDRDTGCSTRQIGTVEQP